MPELLLDDARVDAGLSVVDLWLRYFALGGDRTPTELVAYLQRKPAPPAREHNLIVHAINEHHLEQGGAHPVPYIDEPG